MNILSTDFLLIKRRNCQYINTIVVLKYFKLPFLIKRTHIAWETNHILHTK